MNRGSLLALESSPWTCFAFFPNAKIFGGLGLWVLSEPQKGLPKRKWVKMKPPRGPQFMFPLTRVAFGVPIFDPQ